MKLSISPLALLGIIPTVLAQGPNVTFINGLLETLSNRNLSAFASVAQSLNGSGVGQYLLANISNGEPHILFVPTNEARKPLVLLSAVNSSLTWLPLVPLSQWRMLLRMSLRIQPCLRMSSGTISSQETSRAKSRLSPMSPLDALCSLIPDLYNWRVGIRLRCSFGPSGPMDAPMYSTKGDEGCIFEVISGYMLIIFSQERHYCRRFHERRERDDLHHRSRPLLPRIFRAYCTNIERVPFLIRNHHHASPSACL